MDDRAKDPTLPRPPTAWLLAAAVALVGAAGCGPARDLLDSLRDATPRERYVSSLRNAGLEETALGREWLAAGSRALREAPAVELPAREAGYLPADRPSAAGYRVAVRRGQVLEVEVRLEADEPVRMFLDLFARRTEADSVEFLHLASADSGVTRVEWEADRDEEWVLRLQPELLRSARYVVELVAAPSMAFPVSGHGSAAIRSGFGVPREAGRRIHHGVDIFAPRGTPVLAATAGEVTRVGTNRLGGKIVWVRDWQRSQGLYYAHLDSQLVRRGEQVRPGDTLGLVGNSGNARTTPPHLHFGIYRRGAGPVDPYPFIHRPGEGLPEVAADTARLGGWLRTTDRAHLRSGPSLEAPVVDTLARHTVARARAAAGEWFRIGLPDGRDGYVHAGLVETAVRPLRRLAGTGRDTLREAPRENALVIGVLPAETGPSVLGAFRDFLLVEGPGGRPAWLRPPAAGS